MMRKLKTAGIAVALGSFLCLAGSQGSLQAMPRVVQAPDNTAVNKGDAKSTAATADNAKNGLTDRQLMRNIRRDVVKDSSLSTYGKNVKIIADHGKVTLRGPVNSDSEKQAIEEHAKKYAGDGNVTNNLTVKGKA